MQKMYKLSTLNDFDISAFWKKQESGFNIYFGVCSKKKNTLIKMLIFYINVETMKKLID